MSNSPPAASEALAAESRIARDEEAVFAVFGAIKWVIIGSIILIIGVLAWKVYSGFVDWSDENCEPGQSTAACIAEGAAFSMADIVYDGIVGAGAGLFSAGQRFGRNLGTGNMGENQGILANIQTIWRSYFGG